MNYSHLIQEQRYQILALLREGFARRHEDRSRFGDLEMDTIVGKNHQQSLVSIVDRKTGYL